jgi:hypothetical protein
MPDMKQCDERYLVRKFGGEDTFLLAIFLPLR